METQDADQIPAETAGGKPRSETTYPYYGLARAIEVVQAVRRAGGSEASNTDVMRELNVAKTSERTWAYGIPAAQHFGLVERVGRGDDGRIRLTELATRIVLPASPEEARAAKAAAFRNPELYAKLLEKFAGHPIPTKDGLRNLLHRDFRIVESMAPIAADAFLESLRTAELVTAANMIAPLGGTAPEKTTNGGASETPEPPPNSKALLVPADFVIYKCKITGGRIIDLPLPPDFSSSDVKRLHAFLQTQVDDDESEGP